MLRTRLKVSALIIGLGACSITASAQQTQPNPAASAQQPGRAGLPGRGMRRRARIGRLRAVEQINLTDAQRQQARTIIQNQAQSTRAQREELRQLMQQSRTSTLTAEQQARARELRGQLRASRKGVRTQMMNVLTADQKAKLQELRELRRANHQERKRRRPLE